jgi:hypothetical protein
MNSDSVSVTPPRAAVIRETIRCSSACNISCRGWLSALRLALLVTWLLLTAVASFANAVGIISLDQYVAKDGSPNSGLRMVAHYSITDTKGLANCCDPRNLRWMQLVSSSAPVSDFTPNPNRPFIDPRKGQKGGNQVGDNLPYYDGTYPRDPNKYNDSTNLGVGPYIFDQPQVQNTEAKSGSPYTFTAETILVCITRPVGKPAELTILGGFQWGFRITRTDDKKHHKTTYTTTPLTPTGLADSAAMETQFNTALNLDFPGYKLVPCKDTGCGDSTFNFVSPEPSTLLIFATGMAGASLLLPKLGRHQ